MKILFLMLKVRQDFHNSFTCALNKFPKVEVKEYNYLNRFREVGQEKMNKEVISIVQSYKPDITLCIMYQDQIKKETFKELSKHGTIVLGWFCDDRARFDNYSKYYAPYLDYSITTDFFSVPKYEKIGCRVILSQWGSTPDLFKPIKEEKKIYDVSFIGGPHGGRQEYINFLKSNGIEVAWFGKDASTYLNIDEQNKVISQSKINLNFTGNSHDPSIKQIKTRFFEITSSGGFLLSEYAPKIEDFFIPGKEIETFVTKEELVDKIKYYLTHPKEREEIARRGYLRSIKEHTYTARFRNIFRRLFQDNPNLKRKRLFELEEVLRNHKPRECNDPNWIEQTEWLKTTLNEAEMIKSLCYGKEVLDLCCGTGWCTNEIAKVAKSVTGIDNNIYAIEYAKTKYAGRFFLMDAINLKFRKNAFDVVILREALEHFPESQIEKLFAEITRVIKPNGVLFGTTPIAETSGEKRRLLNANKFHKKIYTHKELSVLLSKFFDRYEIKYENYSSPRASFVAWDKKCNL